jgi:hypothetical protein
MSVGPLSSGSLRKDPCSSNILGDVGGWETGAQLEYQWAGLLGYPDCSAHAAFTL